MKYKVYIENIGCERRGLDARKLANCLTQDSKYEVIQTPKNSVIIIVYTCGFANFVEEKNIRRIIELKRERSKLIIGGCLGAINPKITEELGDEFFIPANEKKIENILKIKSCKNYNSNTLLLNDPNITNYKYKDVWFVKISTGCTGRCTYCKIKQAIGPFKSRKPKTILDEIKKGLEKGYSKIQLESEDSGAYGIDLNISLPILLKKGFFITKDFHISLIKDLSPEWLLKDIQAYMNIFKKNRIKYILCPIQSGSQRILKLMNRRYDIKKVMELFGEINKNVKIWTQIIVGFPTETEQDFEETKTFLTAFKPDIIDIFEYKENNRVTSSKLYPKVSQLEIIKRKEKLEELFKDRIGSARLYRA